MAAFSKLTVATVTLCFAAAATAQNVTNGTTTSNLIPDVLVAQGLTQMARLNASNPTWSTTDMSLIAPTDAAIKTAYGTADFTTVAAPQGFSTYSSVIDPSASSKYYVLTTANPPVVWYNVTAGNTSTIYVRWGTGQSVAVPYAATNGFVYAVNSVIQAPQNVSTMLAANAGSGSTSGVSTQAFLAALTAANMTGATASGSLDLLAGTTIFVPSDDAMAKYATFLSGLTADQKRYVLQYHIVPTNVQYSTTLKTSNFFPSLAGGSVLTVTANNVTVKVNNATVILSDCFQNNGVVHIIDEVLIPTPLPGTVASPVASPIASAVASPVASAAAASPTSTGAGSSSSLTKASGSIERVAVSAFAMVFAILLAILVL